MKRTDSAGDSEDSAAMAKVTVRSECPSCHAPIRVVAEAHSDIEGRCRNCGTWLKFPAPSQDSLPRVPAGPQSGLNLLRATPLPPPGRPRPPAPPPPVRMARPSNRPVLLSSAVVLGLLLIGLGLGWWLGPGNGRNNVATPIETPSARPVRAEPSQTEPNRPLAVASGSAPSSVTFPADLPQGLPPATIPTSPEDVQAVTDPGRPDLPNLGRPGEVGEKYALLIGVREYDQNGTGLRRLNYTESDVDELADVLKSAGFREHNVVVMTQTRGVEKLRLLPERTRILEQLASLLEDRGPQDTVLVAFAGHGVQFKGEDESFFCPVGTKLDDRNTLLSYRDVYAALERSKAGFCLMLSDACRNQPVMATARRVETEVESVTRPEVPRAARGIAAFYSCSPGEVAYEDQKLKHGVFFHHLIEGLKGDADLFSDGHVTLDELFSYTSKHVPDFVRSQFEAKQTPHLVGDVRREFVIARVTRARQIPEVPGTPVSGENTKPADPGGDNLKNGLDAEAPVGKFDPKMAEKNRIPPGNYPAEVVVPNVTGETVSRARDLLHAQGLGLELSTNFGRDTDVVRSQSLFAGKKVASGSIVKLGQLRARVPNVVGKTYREAMAILEEEEGFKLKSGLRVDSPLEITHQLPVAGSLHQRGAAIEVNHMFDLPDMTGRDLQAAKKVFEEQGVAVAIDGFSASGDTVFSQTPRGGRQVAWGITVRLTPGCPAPNLIGSYTLAQATLVRMGIPGRVTQLRTIQTNNPRVNTDAIVEWQSATPGSIVSRRTEIQVRAVRYEYLPTN